MNQATKKVILINGGRGVCARFIGQLILGRGDSVILLDRDGDDLHKNYDWLADTCRIDADSDRLAIYPLDPAGADANNCERLRTELAKNYSAIDTIVHNNAALCPPQGLDEISAEDWSRSFQVNLHTPWLIQKALLGLQRKRGGGRVIFLVDDTDQAWLGAYALSKTAQIHLLHAWSRELKPGRAQGDPVVIGLNIAKLATEARHYFFPGLKPETSAIVEQLSKQLNKALAVEAIALHGKILDCG